MQLGLFNLMTQRERGQSPRQIYAAPQTKRIRLGPAVIVAPLYHPLRMLEEISLLTP